MSTVLDRNLDSALSFKRVNLTQRCPLKGLTLPDPGQHLVLKILNTKIYANSQGVSEDGGHLELNQPNTRSLS